MQYALMTISVAIYDLTFEITRSINTSICIVITYIYTLNRGNEHPFCIRRRKNILIETIHHCRRCGPHSTLCLFFFFFFFSSLRTPWGRHSALSSSLTRSLSFHIYILNSISNANLLKNQIFFFFFFSNLDLYFCWFRTILAVLLRLYNFFFFVF